MENDRNATAAAHNEPGNAEHAADNAGQGTRNEGGFGEGNGFVLRRSTLEENNSEAETGSFDDSFCDDHGFAYGLGFSSDNDSDSDRDSDNKNEHKLNDNDNTNKNKIEAEEHKNNNASSNVISEVNGVNLRRSKRVRNQLTNST